MNTSPTFGSKQFASLTTKKVDALNKKFKRFVKQKIIVDKNASTGSAYNPRKKQTHSESLLQQNCIRWFDYSYPKYRMLLFAIPNGGWRDGNAGTIFKAEGVRAGVADLFLSISRWDQEGEKEYHGFYIEMKFGKNKMSAEQVEFKKQVQAQGYKHVVCYSFDEFEKEINDYLQ